MDGREDAGLSPPVAEIVERVNSRMASAATVREISALADQASRDARGRPLTLAQIEELAAVAMDRARQVESLSARLAELMAGDG